MRGRNLDLSPRSEGTREQRVEQAALKFSLAEIRQHFDMSLNSAREQFAVADSLAASGNLSGCQYIWRSQIVLTEGFLDFYIHEMSKFCLFRMFNGQWEKSQQYNNFPVPMELVEKARNSTGTSDWFFNYLSERFSRDVFLSKESMRDQLNLIGIDYSQVMRKAFPKEDDPIKRGGEEVKKLFRRRNEIAHQNDRSHATAEQNEISKKDVCDYMDKVEAIAIAIYEVAESKENVTVLPD